MVGWQNLGVLQAHVMWGKKNSEFQIIVIETGERKWPLALYNSGVANRGMDVVA
jgi:hypothetical protein